MNDKSQAWDLWMSRKLLSAVAVSMYVKDIRQTIDDALPLLGDDSSRLLCAIACDSDKTIEIYLRNIETARKYHAMGQVTWYSDAVLDDLAALKAGPYQNAVCQSFRFSI